MFFTRSLQSFRGARATSLLAAGATLVALSGAAAAQFATALALPVGASPDSVAIGDWDGDGDADLAVPVDAPDRVVFLFNNGKAGFGGAVSVATGANTGPHTAVAADLDGDGDIDVAVSLQNADAVRVLLNNGAGAFSLGGLFATGAEPRALRVADFNGGLPDLVSGNRSGNSVTVLLNAGAASFTATTLATGQDVRDVNVGDLNGDGDLDLVATAHDDRRLDLFANNGAGAFSAAGTVSLGAQLRPDGIVAADLDADGDTDLAVAASGNGLNVVARFLNVGAGLGAGAFAGPVSFATGGVSPVSIVAGDWDLDGDLDVATANQDSANVSVLANGGTGSFGTATPFATGSQASFVTAADLDGNGSLDLVAANTGSASVSLLINLNEGSAFTNLGGGLAGVAGIPSLAGAGTLQAGSPVSITLSGAANGAAAAVVFGLTTINAPFKGGTLVPQTDVVIVLATSGAGGLAVAGAFPAGVPSGTDLFVQAVVADASGVKGFALSHALQGVTP